MWNISPWYFLIAYIPTALLGSLPVLILGSICYITDITNDNERGWHMAWLEALVSFGLLLGLFIGPKILDIWGYTAVFSIATLSCTVALLYLFFIPETIQNQNSVSVVSILVEIVV